MVPVQRYFPIFAWFCPSPRGHRGKKSDSHYQPSQFFLYWLSWGLLQHVDTFVSLSHSFFRLVNSLNINYFKLCSLCDPLSIILSHNHLILLSHFRDVWMMGLGPLTFGNYISWILLVGKFIKILLRKIRVWWSMCLGSQHLRGRSRRLQSEVYSHLPLHMSEPFQMIRVPTWTKSNKTKQSKLNKDKSITQNLAPIPF